MVTLFAMRLLQILIFLALVVLSGCVVMRNQPVIVEVKNLKLLRVSPFDQRFKVIMVISNQGSKELFVRRLKYHVILGSLEISSGEELIWKTVPAFSTQEIDMFFSTNIWGQLSPIFASAKENGQLNYYLEGELKTGNLFYQEVSYIRYANALTQDQLPMKKLEKLQKLMPNLSF